MKALPAASAGSHGAERLPAPPGPLFRLPWQELSQPRVRNGRVPFSGR